MKIIKKINVTETLKALQVGEEMVFPYRQTSSSTVRAAAYTINVRGEAKYIHFIKKLFHDRKYLVCIPLYQGAEELDFLVLLLNTFFQQFVFFCDSGVRHCLRVVV